MSELDDTRYFGPRPWGVAIDEPQLMDEKAPVGELCYRCGEPIDAGDFGLIMPAWPAPSRPLNTKELGFWRGANLPSRKIAHRECFLRCIIGSVGHLEMRCSCFGGSAEDPPEMSRREAAIAAVKLFELHRAKALKDGDG